ncbi:MAG TPA: non-canonical purine NTP pyrophosphatase [Chloroflexota bacterium]|nr:non-canonical purine NTP pyrophosphatase [Chloroflexota bacterium]
MKSNSLTFITGSLDKVKLLDRYLGVPVRHRKLDLVEIQSLDLDTVVRAKAIEAYRQLGSPVLVEDTSLRFSALGRLPGPFVKWFLLELGTSGLCRLLDGYENRSALAEVQFAVYDGTAFRTFANAREGSITSSPRGEHGFGWDPIFIPRGEKRTWGEMTAEEQKATSLRRPALEQLAQALR